MEKMHVGIIYTIKQNGHSRDAIRKFMSKYTGSEWHYSDEAIDRLLANTMCEAVRDNEHPSSIVREYFEWRREPWCWSDFDAICAALESIQVRRENFETKEWEFINGFYKLEGLIDD